MAAANTTVIDKVRANAGQLNGIPVDYVGPASYSTGGDLLTAQQLGLKNIYAIQICAEGTMLNSIVPLFTTNKAVQSLYLAWIVIATGAEVAAAVNLSARRCRLMVWGN